MDCCNQKRSYSLYVLGAILALAGILALVTSCGTTTGGALGDKVNYASNDQEYRNKFSYTPEEGEKVLRYWYHYIVSKVDEGYKVRIFHPDKKVLTEERTYSTPALTLLHGPYKRYWDDGSIRDQGFYQFGRRHGGWLECEPGKGKSSSGQYVNDRKEGQWTQLDTNGMLESVYTWSNGQLHGKFYEYDTLGQKINEGIYKTNTLISELHKQTRVTPPYFRECLDNQITMDRDSCTGRFLLQQAYSSIKYPSKARQMGISGEVVIQWDVLSDGTVRNLRIPQALCDEIEAECLKVFAIMPEWAPARRDGTPVKYTFAVPLHFKLQ